MEWLYRGMKRRDDGFPETGPSSNKLGARPGKDLPVEEGRVKPQTGGMSTTVGGLERLPFHARPRHLGGDGQNPVFRLSTDDLGACLAARADDESNATHRVVEPTVECEFDQYQLALFATRTKWEVVWPI